MIYFIIAALIVLLDQVSKYFLTIKLSGGGVAALLPGLVHMIYVQNTGAAFSFLQNVPWLLIAVSSVVILLIAAGLIRYRNRIDWVGKLGLGFILGGALSNLFDRAIFGYVADFFEFEFVRFAVFNVADIFITVGGVVFCLWYLFKGSKGGGLREEFMLGKGRDKKAGPRDAAERDGAQDSVTPEGSGGADHT
ncbi:signal peptidase II [Sporobacter termitidis DSM 10068]|uniref:Lipoprotein signal peptidase n=1 Tax=Sporobacter termitidis DSM 10068 TaxID=1123282 RepID=A0A1M5Z859_9FIRM|nr:signal peptidase II [Sporobacter termitidis]SHI20083.1 signal peptidase II [Sporobacter termitidis DSM 10068]